MFPGWVLQLSNEWTIHLLETFLFNPRLAWASMSTTQGPWKPSVNFMIATYYTDTHLQLNMEWSAILQQNLSYIQGWPLRIIHTSKVYQKGTVANGSFTSRKSLPWRLAEPTQKMPSQKEGCLPNSYLSRSECVFPGGYQTNKKPTEHTPVLLPHTQRFGRVECELRCEKLQQGHWETNISNLSKLVTPSGYPRGAISYS